MTSRRSSSIRCGLSSNGPVVESTTANATASGSVSRVARAATTISYLGSVDGDPVPAVHYLRETFPEKVLVGVPPRGRRSDELLDAIGRKRELSRSRYAAAQLPDRVTSGDGTEFVRPEEWSNGDAT